MNQNTLIAILLACLLGLVVVLLIGYHVIRFLRGRIRITLPRKAYDAGEVIEGSFTLEIKKPLEGRRLVARLIGTEHTRSSSGNSSHNRSREIHRKEVVVEKGRKYRPGEKAEYAFAIPTPSPGAPGLLDSSLAKTVIAAARVLSTRRTEVRWKVEVRLELKGVDVASSRGVTINGLNT